MKKLREIINQVKVGTLLSVGMVVIIGLIISASVYSNYLTSDAQNTIRKSTLRMFDVFSIENQADSLFSQLTNLDVVIKVEELNRSEKVTEEMLDRSKQTVEESKQKDVFSSEELERIEDLVEDAESASNEIFRLKRRVISTGLDWDEFGVAITTKDTKELKDQFDIVRYLQFEIKEVVGGVVSRSDSEFRQAMGVVERSLILTWVVIGVSLALALGLAYYLVKSVKKIYDLKNEFVNIIAHDLRNPVTAINGYLEMITTGTGQKKEELQESLQAIKVSALKLGYQINNLLEVGRTEAGRVKLSLEAVKPYEVIKESVTRAKALADVSGIKIVFAEKDKDVYISADRSKLSDVLDNLISNAIKYNKEKGNVTVTTTETETSFSVSVADNGHGIPADQQQNIFKKYSRAGAEKKKVRGTGLGLYASKISMDNMKGKISFVSKENEGTTFTASFRKVDKNYKVAGQKSTEEKDKVKSETKKA